MCIYSCGSSSFHELALGATERSFVSKPTRIELNRSLNTEESLKVQQAVGGRQHIVILVSNDKGTKTWLLTCGSNERQQLGRDGSWSKLQPILFDSHSIVHVACGQHFNCVLTDAGQVFSWGCNEYGQLGLNLETESASKPTLLKALAREFVVQISCGSYHAIALTKTGRIYSWGANNYGQLGLGYKSLKEIKPQHITPLSCSPLQTISSGGYHSFALSCTGALYVWGKNEFGQLGLGDTDHRASPTCLTHLRHQRISYVTGGEDFTAALTEDGGIFTWGAGMYGQTGHGAKTNETLPKRILEMIGSKVVGVACGRCHMVLLLQSSKVLTCGLNGCGQLGIPGTQDKLIPSLISEFDDREASFEEKMELDVEASSDKSRLSLSLQMPVFKISTSRGDHTFIIFGEQDEKPSTKSFWDYYESSISKIENQVLESFKLTASSEAVPMHHMDVIETAFGSIACWNGSYVLKSQHLPAIDWNSLRHGMSILQELPNGRYVEVIMETIIGTVLPELPSSLEERIDPEILRVYLMLPMMHIFLDDKTPQKVIIEYARCSLRLLKSDRARCELENWLKDERNACHSRKIVKIYKKLILRLFTEQLAKYLQDNDQARSHPEQIVTYDSMEFIDPSHPHRPDHRMRFRLDSNIQENLGTCLNFLQFHFKISQKSGTMCYKEFYIPEISELVDIGRDYIYWLSRNRRPYGGQSSNDLYLCNYPFIFDTKAKSCILGTDSALQQKNAAENALYRNLIFAGPITVFTEDPHLVITVSRKNIIQDTIAHFLINGGNLNFKKPLKVKFEGEDAVDAGIGMKKEFFLLVLKEILDPKYGMFIEYKDTNTIWFNPLEKDTISYELIGIICGLAIYNQAIINLPFPLVLYKKILEEELSLDDLASIDATLTKNLREILNPDLSAEEFDSIFGELNFTLNMEIFGSATEFPLIKNRQNTKLTLDNRQLYVNLYWNFLLNDCIEEQFSAFNKGFLRVVDKGILKFFHAEELLEMITGQEVDDWNELEASTSYKPPFNKLHPTIVMFWKIFHSFTEKEKRQFLLFLTGSDRVPIQGMKSIRMGIQPMKVSDEHLPVAHTCFNILDLPETYYSDEKMRKKLLQAINHSSIFTLA